MKLILHCGTSKTGTTTLQNCFHASRKALATEGVLYPDPMFGQNSHLALIARFRAPARLSKRVAQALGGPEAAPQNGRIFWEAFAEKLAATRPEVVVMSCEYLFQSLNPGELTQMKRAFRALDLRTTPVVYLREPASWFASSSQQDAKMGRPLKVPGAQAIRQPLENLQSVFGRLTLRKFARGALEGDDIVTDFVTQVLGRPDLLPLLSRDDRNVSISAEACAVLETYRRHMAADAVGLMHRGTRRLLALISRLEAADPDGPARPVLRQEVAQSVRLASDDYIWLRDTHGISFAEFEAARALAPTASPALAATPTPPSIADLFHLDPHRRDRLIARLMHEAIEPTEVEEPAVAANPRRRANS